MSELEIWQRINALQTQIDTLTRREGQRPILDNYLNLFTLKALWNFATVDGNYNARDLSGNGLTLTNNSMTFSITAQLFPYGIFGGSSYYSHINDSGLNLSAPGTIGGWFYVDALTANNQGLMGKWNAAGNQRSYFLYVGGSGIGNSPEFAVSSDGTAITKIGNANGVPVMSTGKWVFLAASYYPSSYLTLYINTVKYSNVTSIPASINAGTAPFEIGRVDSGSALTGRATLCFMTNWVLNDNQVRKLYNCSKWAFGA